MPAGTRPASLFGRLAASGAIVLFAALVAASGLDRLSVESPAARAIPAFMKAQSARSASARAIARRDPSQAVASARTAVAADPINPASTALLGSAYLLAGQDDRAEAAFRVAARFGWREPSTQLYWYEAALQAGDYPRAVERADALMRVRTSFSASKEVLLPLESTPDGRTALVRRMADKPGWLTTYLKLEEPDDALIQRRTQVLAALGAAGTHLGCEAVTPFVEAAIDHGARRQAEIVWTAHCPGAELDSGLADGGFEKFQESSATPFGWRAEHSGDVTIRPTTDAHGAHAVELSNSAPVSRMVLFQAVSLEPGTYKLTAKGPAGRIAGSFGCDVAPPLPSLSDGDMTGAGQILHAGKCATLELGIWVRPGSGPVEIDDVKLEKVG